MSGIVRDIVNARVGPDDLEQALQAINKLPQKDRRDLTARSLCLIGVFSKDRAERDVGTLIAAIDWRFRAIAALATRPEFKAWSLPMDHVGAAKIDPLVLRAAAEEPLITDGNTPAFDPDSFFKRLLALSEEAGRG
jgi:hypothetical protein